MDHRLDDKTLDELDELEDDEEDEFLASYRAKRMQELKSFTNRAKFGLVQPLSKPDFVREVTEASEKDWVFIHLFKDSFGFLYFQELSNGASLPLSKLLAARFEEFAHKYPTIKCLKIPGDQCIEHYPEKNMPTLLVYGPNTFRDQLVGLADLGGRNCKVQGQATLYLHKSNESIDLENYALSIDALSKEDFVAAEEL